MTLALAVLAASLVGSPHCAGMCGPFACFYAGGQPVPAGRSRAALHAAYNGGRLLSYVVLGALAGLLGAGLDGAGRLGGISRLAAVAAGALMVGWGLARLATLHGVRLLPGSGPAAPRRWLARLVQAQRARPPVARALATGLLTTLLPCGWLYAFVVTAAGTGSASGGALVMLAFWVGTLPVLVAVGAGAQRLAGPFARRLPAASAAALVVLGLLTMGGRLRADLSLARMLHAAPAAATVPAPQAAHAGHAASAPASHDR